jgi:hypothetical protein
LCWMYGAVLKINTAETKRTTTIELQLRRPNAISAALAEGRFGLRSTRGPRVLG